MKKFDKVIYFTFVLVLFALITACSSLTNSNNDGETDNSETNSQQNGDKNEEAGELYGKIKEKGVIEAGSTSAGPPFTFLNPKTNEIEGMMIDIGERVAEELDLEMNINPVEFTSLVPSIEGEKIDMVVAGLAKTEEREKAMNFSETVYTYGEVIVIPKDNDEIKSFEDLQGKKVGVQEASTSYDELKKHSDIDIQTYKTQQDMAKELDFGRIDAFMPDYPIYVNLEKEMPELTEDFKLAPDHESQWLNDIGLGVPKGEAQLLDDVNKVIKEMEESGEIDEIIAKYED